MVVLADVDERVLLGELVEGGAERALLLRSDGEHDGLERRAREAGGRRRRRAAARRSRRRRGRRPGRGPWPSRRPRGRRGAARRSGRRPGSRSAWPPPLPRPGRAARGAEGAGEQAHVGDALARRRPLDLEHAARDGSRPGRRGRPAGARRSRRASASTPMPRAADAEEDRVDDACRGLDARAAARSRSVRERGLVADVRAQDRLVVLGEDLGQRGRRGRRRRTLNGTNVAVAACRRRGRVPIGTTAGRQPPRASPRRRRPGRRRPGRSC